MMATRLLFILFFSFATILPCLCADMAQYDDVWQKRAEEAKKHTMEAYVPNPLETDEEADSQSVHIGSPPPTSSGLPPQTCAQPQNDTVGTANGAESPTKGEQTITADQTSPSPTPTPAVAEDDDEDTAAAAVAGNTNATRRGLRQGKRLYKGPCAKTNPIDKCWRCRKSWSKNRRRLAKCALGFGRKTTGGADGRIYVVTDNSDDDFLNPKPGTLRYAVIQKEPLWIIFAHSMNIKLNKELIMAGNKTIDGRGANVHIAYGAGITIQFVSNVIIHGIRIHHIVPTGGGLIRDSVDHFGFRTQSDGDGISIFGSTKVWIDHVSMSNCTDGLIDAIQGSTAVTISNCHFTHHNDAILLGASDSFSGDQFMQITVAYNHFGQGLVQRMPRCRWGFFHVVNNDYTHWRLYAIGGSQHPTIISQGNRFIAPDEHELKQVTKRDYAAESEWRNWIWRSEGDLFMNGAYFIESGQQNLKPKQQKKFMITPKPAVFATKMTRMAGALDCRPKQKC